MVYQFLSYVSSRVNWKDLAQWWLRTTDQTHESKRKQSPATHITGIWGLPLPITKQTQGQGSGDWLYVIYLGIKVLICELKITRVWLLLFNKLLVAVISGVPLLGAYLTGRGGLRMSHLSWRDWYTPSSPNKRKQRTKSLFPLKSCKVYFCLISIDQPKEEWNLDAMEEAIPSFKSLFQKLKKKCWVRKSLEFLKLGFSLMCK